jgi:hypothetical protein
VIKLRPYISSPGKDDGKWLKTKVFSLGVFAMQKLHATYAYGYLKG